MTDHAQYLLQALDQAQIGRGFCAPNPAVGAVIVKNQRIIAVGFHHGTGQPHAEIEALNHCQESPAGATLYVTLEPCCHFGRTPPCTDRIIQEKISEVIYGFQDPNPIVAGRGAAILREHHITCEQIETPQITAFYRSYDYWTRHRLPYITAKLALSLDGKIAGPNGARVNITGAEAATFTHTQRKQADAILTTATTIFHDDPKLNARCFDQTYAKKIYVLDRKLRVPPQAQIFLTSQTVTHFHDKRISAPVSISETNFYYGVTCDEHNYLVWSEVIKKIGEDGIHDLWVEAGSTCLQSLLQQNLVQRVYLYINLQTLGVHAQNAFDTATQVFHHANQITWRNLGNDGLVEINLITNAL